MKKKVIVILAICAIVFLMSGSGIVFYIEQATATMSKIIKLHQVELLRDKLLIHIKRVQNDLSVKNTRYAKNIDKVVRDVVGMDDSMTACYGCHHDQEVLQLFEELQGHIENYKNALSRLFTMRANEQRLAKEEDAAFRIGVELIDDVEDILDFAGSRLARKTEETQVEIERIRRILFVMLGFGPLVIAGLAFFMIRALARPVDALLEATRKIKKGDFSGRIEGLKDEFGEVADSFNEMAVSLKNHMEAMQESEKRYRTLFESAGDGICIIEAKGEQQGRIVSANQAAATMFGYPKETMLSLSFRDLTTPEANQSEGDWLHGIMQGRWMKRETFRRRRDGAVFPSSESAGLLEVHGRRCILIFIRDITESKKLEEQLHHAQRVEAIGRLTGGVAHEFNNILQAIIAYGENLQRQLGADSELKKSADMIVASCLKGADLTRGLLAYSRKQAIRWRPVSINAVFRGVENLLSRLIDKQISFTVSFPDDEMKVMADAHQLEQVLINLINNAVDAIDSQGAISLGAQWTELGVVEAEQIGLEVPGRYVLITVADTGVGMDESTRDKIFEPFFTTKEIGKGTGLGLSIVYGIIGKHKGHISVTSEAGKGTEFRILLPDAGLQVVARSLAQKVIRTEDKAGRNELILVAEDDDTIRQIVVDWLGDAGYRVLQAADGVLALRQFALHSKEVALFLSDVVMPGKNGRQVYEEIRVDRPDMKALFISGYTDEELFEKGVLDSEVALLTKPILPEELLRKVRQLLDQPAHL